MPPKNYTPYFVSIITAFFFCNSRRKLFLINTSALSATLFKNFLFLETT